MVLCVLLVDNWVRELKLWSPHLKVLVYYGKIPHSPMMQPLFKAYVGSIQLNKGHKITCHRTIRKPEAEKKAVVLFLHAGSVEDRRYMRHNILNGAEDFHVIVST